VSTPSDQQLDDGIQREREHIRVAGLLERDGGSYLDLRPQFLYIFLRLLVVLVGFRLAVGLGFEFLDGLAQAVAAHHLGL
jgi:hypothetical protein